MRQRYILNELFKFRSLMDINQYNDLVDDYTRIMRYIKIHNVTCQIEVRDDFGIAVTVTDRSPAYGHLLHDMIWKQTRLNRDVSVTINYTDGYKKKVERILRLYFSDTDITFDKLRGSNFNDWIWSMIDCLTHQRNWNLN